MEFNDNIMRDALLDASEEEFSDILDGQDTPVRFSKKYLSRRKRFLNDPVKYISPKNKTWQKHLARAAAVFIVVASLLLSNLFTGTASASEIQMMTKAYKDHLTYNFSQEYTPQVDMGDWYAAYLPDGFSVYKTEDNGDFCSTHYVNGSSLIDFVYFHTSAYLNINLQGGNYMMETCIVNGATAIFHRAEKEGASNVLMWFSESGDMVFLIDAPLPIEEMIKIAENIELRK